MNLLQIRRAKALLKAVKRLPQHASSVSTRAHNFWLMACFRQSGSFSTVPHQLRVVGSGGDYELLRQLQSARQTSLRPPAQLQLQPATEMRLPPTRPAQPPAQTRRLEAGGLNGNRGDGPTAIDVVVCAAAGPKPASVKIYLECWW